MPVVAVAVLENQIAKRRLAPLYLLTGDDVRLAERLVDEIEATVDEGDRPFAVERVYAGDPGGQPLDIAAAARSLPMLGDRRIVIVLRAERFLKPKRQGKPSESDEAAPDPEAGETGELADLAPLEEYVDAPVATNVLVFVASEIDKSRRLTKRLLQAAQVVECAGFVLKDERGKAFYDRRVAERQALDELKAADRSIDPEGLRRLVDAAGDDVSKLRDDVARLLLYTQGRARITAADVADVTSGEGIVDDWGLVNAIGAGELDRGLREVGRRLDRGDSPHAIVGQLRWWVSERLAEGAPDRVKAAVEALIRTDLALKSSGGDERVLLERLVVELTGRALPAGRGWGGRR